MTQLTNRHRKDWLTEVFGGNPRRSTSGIGATFIPNNWPGGDVAAGRLRWLAVWAAIFASLSLAVHMRLLAGIDNAGLQFLAGSRPTALADAVNWIFRLGYVHVDTALALLWAGLLLVWQRSLLVALPPLVLFGAIGAQVGVRLVIDQPGPGREYAVRREFDSHPAVLVTDQLDYATRETVVDVITPRPPKTPSSGSASFPSGHAARSLFLALLASYELRKRSRRRALPGSNLLAAMPLVLAGLVGYSAMYFGYHWPSDVLGGYLLAIATYQVAAWLRDATPMRRADGRISYVHST